MSESRRPSASAVAALLVVLALCSSTLAQTWVPIGPPTPPGTPSEARLVAGESDATRTTVEVVIHGFWQQDVLGDDGITYQRLTFPGLESIGQIGAPELPAVRFALATAGQGSSISLASVEVFNTEFVSGIHLYPTPGEAEDEDPSEDPGPGDTQGYDEKFAFDAAIYSSTDAWPDKVAASSFAVERMLGPIEGAAVSLAPVAWVPIGDRLIVYRNLKVSFSHPLGVFPESPITKLKAEAAGKLFTNWEAASFGYLANLINYQARYLIIAPASYWDSLAPFKQHKQALGYQVSLRPVPGGITPVRDTIAAWYADGDPGMDHYCLLVGDVASIPLAVVLKNGVPVFTDDLYGAVGDDSLFKDVHVGRLSVDDEADMQRQLKKIMDYETQPVVGGDYDEVLLVAHKQGAPGKYQGAHEAVRTASYAHPPVFKTRYGSSEVGDAGVANDIDDGVGVVAYRGHGSTNAWSDWNLGATWFNKGDVLGLANSVTPVVWSFACTNANLAFDDASSDDCLAETWMEADGVGAVASYAATQTTSTTVNHKHDKLLFEVVYDGGITTHGQALDLAELLLNVSYPGHKNPWAYLLLGDPSMTIRTKKPSGIFTSLPTSSQLEALGGGLTVTAVGPSGAPLVGGLFSAHKSSFLKGVDDEVQSALWLDGAGQAQLAFENLTPGVIECVTRTADGSVLPQSIEVTMGDAWTDLGHGLAGDGSVVPQLVGVGTLQGGQPMSLLMRNARPLSTAWFILSLVEDAQPFKGGLIIPCVVPPSIILPLPTDSNGNLAFTVTWPDGVPSHTDVFTQYWIQDAGGPFGFSASNGLQGTTP